MIDMPFFEFSRTPKIALLVCARWISVLSAVLLTGCATSIPQPPPEPSSIVLPQARTETPLAPPAAQSKPQVLPTGKLRDIELGRAVAPTVAALAAPADLWQRIRRGFAMSDLSNELVQNQEQWYSTRPDYIERMTERSRKYLFHIVEELERRNMPTELALLPFIESAFNPQAVSHAKAAGMWQFMPATGKDFDLKQNMFRDDRRDVLASTRAALDYLQLLHGMFKDWHLALAAYNWGQGNVKRAIERNAKKGLPTGYEDLTMPLETRMYVPKLQAVKNIVANPAAFSATLPAIDNHPFFETVSINRDIDVALAARLAQVNEADFRALNPSIHRPVILASGTPHILLPWNNASVFQRNLQFHLGPMATWTAWAVPSNMRTAEIADRVGMTESDLRRLNNIPPRMLVRAGSTLIVPRPSQQGKEVPGNLADNAQLNLQPEIVLVRSTVKARKGESLSAMAKRLNVSAQDLAEWNKLATTSALKAGQQLAVFKPRSASRSRKGIATAASKVRKTSAAPKSSKRKAVAETKIRKKSASSDKKSR